MSYLDTVRIHGRNNRFEYNHKAIYKQVRKAMKKHGEERDQALKSVLTSAFKEESVRYEVMRQQLVADLYSMENANEAARLDEAMKNMARPALFLEQMAEIVGEMAKDIDQGYQPKKFIGLTANDAKNLVSFQLSSYTRLDETMYTLKRFGWAEAHRALTHIITDNMTGKPRKFNTTDEENFTAADDEHKSAIYEAYIRKEELKNQLNGKGFFWKLRHRAEVREMRNYINAAEAVLAAVEFPESAIGEARAEFAFTAAKKLEYQRAHKYLDEKLYVAPDEIENLLGDKSPEEMEEIFDQKAAYEDQIIDQINEREAQQKLKEQKKEAQRLKSLASIKKPTNIAEVKSAFRNRDLTKMVTDQFVALMGKATTDNASKESKATSVHKSLGMMLSEVWTNQKNMRVHAINLFKAAYNTIKNDTPDMSVAEKIVAAQKMVDIMLNIYSPVASDPSLAKFGNNFGVQNINNDSIKELTGYEGDISELMSNVKVELGIEKVEVDFGNEFGEQANDKSEKVEEHKAPVAENVKQP